MLFDPYAYDLAAAARQLPSPAAAAVAEYLLEVPEEARATLWHGLMQAIEGALDLWERTPPARRSAPPFTIQHTGKPRFNPDHLRRQTLEGWHRLVAIELRLAVQALEALLCAPEGRASDPPRRNGAYQPLLAEQCARVGQPYAELKRRVGALFALHILRWELRLLRYRASPVINDLLFPAAGR
jgi:hypothetical protein